MVAPQRTERFELRVTELERAKAEALAEHFGVSAADVVRMLLARAYREHFDEKGNART